MVITGCARCLIRKNVHPCVSLDLRMFSYIGTPNFASCPIMTMSILTYYLLILGCYLICCATCLMYQMSILVYFSTIGSFFFFKMKLLALVITRSQMSFTSNQAIDQLIRLSNQRCKCLTRELVSLYYTFVIRIDYIFVLISYDTEAFP
jgi:hypothetical protein